MHVERGMLFGMRYASDVEMYEIRDQPVQIIKWNNRNKLELYLKIMNDDKDRAWVVKTLNHVIANDIPFDGILAAILESFKAKDKVIRTME